MDFNFKLTPEESQGQYTRSRALAAALRFAEAGVPVFPCNHAPDKSPRTRRGFYDASRDPSQVTGMWNAAPGASIGIPTGGRFWVLDVDLDPEKGINGYKGLEKLKQSNGELPDTWTVKTPRGGLHFWFRMAEGVSNSSGGLPEGVDVRGKGGYVLVPPSPGYTVVDRSPIAEAPEWLLEIIRGTDPPGGSKKRSHYRGEAAGSGSPIPEGERNRTLFFRALDIKDAGERAEEVLDKLLAENAHWCNPPLEPGEVEKIAKSATRYPVRSGRATPELKEAVGKLTKQWWEYRWKGLGGQSDRDVLRVLLELALRYGRLNPDGTVDVSASVRSVSLAAATSYVTVSRGAARRLTESGWAEKIPTERSEHADTWRVHAPSRVANTTAEGSGDAVVLAGSDAPPTLPDETPCWRHRGLVGKGAGFVEALLEVYGPMNRDEVADRLGWANARELERRYLRRLESRGLAEVREDGRYALVGHHAEAVEMLKETRYRVLLKGEHMEQTPEGWEPREAIYGRDRSEDERTEADAEEHERQREEFRAELIRRERARDAEDTGSFEEATPATPEMLNATRTGRYLLARGWRRLSRREWASPETGEVLPIDRAMKEAG